MRGRATGLIVVLSALGALVGVALVGAGLAGVGSGGDDSAESVEPADVPLRGAPEGRRTLVVGDSVTFDSADEIAAELGTDHRLDIRGRPGYTTAELVPAVRNGVLASQPEVVVLLTGYNDIWRDGDPEVALTELADFVGTLEVCVVWLLLPTKGPWPVAAAEAYNDRVESLAEEHDNIEVAVEWRDAVDDTDGPAPSTELIDPDQVHPTPAGQARLGEVAAQVTRRLCS